MTPEQKIFESLQKEFKSHLPKGSYLLQRIETSTTDGVPDVYCSVAIGDATNRPIVDRTSNLNLWLETKTLEYRVSKEQTVWAYRHWLTNGLTYLITALPRLPGPPQSNSNTPPYSTPYPTLLDLPRGSASQTKSANRTLVLLAFDDRMLDYSSLGRYIKAVNPPLLPIVDWLALLQQNDSHDIQSN